MGERTYTKSTVIKCSSCGRANIFNQPYPYHAGFSDQGFLYNDAGNLTLTWSCFDPAFEALAGGKSPWALSLADQQKIEDALLRAPSGGCWASATPRDASPVVHRLATRMIAAFTTCFMMAVFRPKTWLHMISCSVYSYDTTPNQIR